MAHNPRSPRLTEAYRRRLLGLATGVEAQAREHWPLIEELDDSQWAERMAGIVTRAQTEAVRATSGYLAAYLRSETGKGRAVPIDTRSYAGLSRDGRPILDALRSPLIGVRTALKTELSTAALRKGLVRATRLVAFETVQAGRDALTDTIEADDRFTEPERAVAGTCAACMALSGTANFEVHPGCFPAGVLTAGPPPVAASKRWHAGDLIEFGFAGGGLLACTPNHPILTLRGWVPAHELSKGCDVIRSRGEQGHMASVYPHDHERPTLIEEVAETLRGAGDVTTSTVPLTAEHFHGDGAHGSGDVHVVAADGLLEGHRSHPGIQQLAKVPLCSRHAHLSFLASLSHLGPLLLGVLASSGGAMRGLSTATVLLGGAVTSRQRIRGRSATDVDSGLPQSTVDGYARDAVPSREGLLRFAGEVETDELVSVRRFPFSGHVYNLQSSSERWYLANRTVVHNCECIPQPKVAGVRDLFPLPTGAALFRSLTKEQQEKAIGPEAAQLVRDGEADLRDFVSHSKTETDQPNWITQRPVDQVAPATE